VTTGGQAEVVNRCDRPTAVCVVRLDHQRNGLLISLRLNLDIAAASGEWRQTFADIDAAIAAIRMFAETFAAQTGDGEPSGS